MLFAFLEITINTYMFYFFTGRFWNWGFLCVLKREYAALFNVDSSFSKGKPIPTSVSIRKLLSMSSYALGSYHTDKQSLAHFLSLPEKDILFFNSVASLGKPACFLALNHHSKE